LDETTLLFLHFKGTCNVFLSVSLKITNREYRLKKTQRRGEIPVIDVYTKSKKPIPVIQQLSIVYVPTRPEPAKAPSVPLSFILTGLL